jgi:ribosomal protein L32
MNGLQAKTSLARPLYVGISQACTISLVRGPALLIAAGGPPHRLPLEHVSRVVLGHLAQLQSDALLACLDAGLTIAMLDKRGAPRAYCHGTRRREQMLGELLLLAMESPEWETHYQQWLDNQRRAHLATALLAIGAPLVNLCPQAGRATLANHYRTRCGQGSAALLARVHGLLQAEVAAQFVQASRKPELIAFHRPGLNLAADFTDVLMPHAQRLMIGWELPPTAADQRPLHAVRMVERHMPGLLAPLAHLLADFERELRRLWG